MVAYLSSPPTVGEREWDENRMLLRVTVIWYRTTCPRVTPLTVDMDTMGMTTTLRFHPLGLGLEQEISKDMPPVKLLYVPGALLSLAVLAYPMGLLHQAALDSPARVVEATTTTPLLPWFQLGVVLFVSAIGPIFTYVMNLRFLEHTAKLRLVMKEESDVIRGEWETWREQFRDTMEKSYVAAPLHALQISGISEGIREIKTSVERSTGRLDNLANASQAMAVEYAKLSTTVTNLQAEVKRLGDPL